ncbi:MAG: flagellar filament capping protein FliD [Treponema sp.]|nr:flagellar filament capping protein FliD [Treponema sp.]
MAGINIPGVSDKYKTNDLVEALMKAERVPLTREQESLDKYKDQQSAWRGVNQKLSTLRDTVKTLYSFDNPFNNKITESSEENAITATADRDAEFGSFKVKVLNPATADRFMSQELPKDFKVPAGQYTFTVNDKTVSFHWKGGKMSEFVSSLNKRGNKTIKADIIGMNNGSQSLIIESLKTGEENHLEFKDDALQFAKETNIISPVTPVSDAFCTQNNEILEPLAPPQPIVEQPGMPAISSKAVYLHDTTVVVPPRGGFTVELPAKYVNNSDARIEIQYTTETSTDITNEINEALLRPSLPSDSIEFEGITVENAQSETALPIPDLTEPLNPITNDESLIYARMQDGSEQLIDPATLEKDEESGRIKATIDASLYSGIHSIVIRNRNTGDQINIEQMSAYNKKDALGFAPNHAISTAGDAVFQYEGITIKRPTNSIDDVVPNVTINITDKTKETATIQIKPDKDSAKETLITFVGKYNQAIAEINILSQDKPEIISELDYLTDSEKETEENHLGMFLGDFSLTNIKSQMQRTVAASYRSSEDSDITMLNEIGIATQASGGAGGYTPSRLRGYLEINEKKLDDVLENNLSEIKNLFGFDSDGDMIIDSGIGYALDKQITGYVQSGGIIASKTSTLDTQIKLSESKIARLQTQLDSKESELRSKYGHMESTLNNLENQQNRISNFANQGQKN